MIMNSSSAVAKELFPGNVGNRMPHSDRYRTEPSVLFIGFFCGFQRYGTIAHYEARKDKLFQTIEVQTRIRGKNSLCKKKAVSEPS